MPMPSDEISGLTGLPLERRAALSPSSPLPPPLSKRARFAQTLDTLGLIDRMLWLRTRLGVRALTVLTYHRVGEPGDSGEFDPEVFDVTPQELDRQIGLIKAHGSLIGLDDLRRFIRGDPRLPKNPVMITFDDGYRDNYDVALPILERHGAEALFFIPTAFPDAGRLFWWDRISLLLRRCTREAVELDYPRKLTLAPRRDPRAAAVLLCKAVKLTPNIDLGRLWDELERATGVVFSAEEERDLAEKTIMGWNKVRSLVARGMSVQSHSHSHKVLNAFTPAEAEADLARSAALLGEVLGGAIETASYPVGYTVDGQLRGAAAAAGFAIGFTNRTGLGDLDRLDPLNVPRVGMDARSVGALYKLLLLTGDRLPHRPRRWA